LLGLRNPSAYLRSTGTPFEDWIVAMSAPLRPRPAAPREAAVPAGGAPAGAPLVFPRTLTVGVIGAGRVGAVLGAALAAAGPRVVAAAGVSGAAKARIALLLPGTRNRSATSVARAATDLLLIAVPDDALAGVVAGLAETRALRPGQVVAHTSGAHGLAVLAPAAAVGARPLALHPAMTFTGRPDDLARLPGACFGVTAPDALRPIAEALVLEMGGDPQWVEEDQRVLYHAALAGGANHLMTLVNESVDLLRRSGVGDPERMLGALLGAAMDNALRAGDAALTGPVARGDAGTVAAHLAALREVSPHTAAAYLAMARLTADRALAAGVLRTDAAGALLDVLAEGAPDR
jgi:predicted short-subunit dehydrogenase-like oxidoreductase (DUF2520 family)